MLARHAQISQVRTREKKYLIFFKQKNSTVYMVAESSAFYSTTDGVNWPGRTNTPFVYGRDITILSNPVSIYIAGGNLSYIFRTTDFGNSFQGLGGSRPTTGFPGVYRPVGELATVGAIGFYGLDGSPLLPSPVPYDVAVTVKSVDIANTFFSISKANAYFDAVDSLVQLRNASLSISTNGQFFGTSLNVFNSSVRKKKNSSLCLTFLCLVADDRYKLDSPKRNAQS